MHRGAHASGSSSSSVQALLQVGIAEHSTTILGEFGHELLDLIAALNTVPEHNLSLLRQTSIGLVKEPGQILIIFLDGPDELWVILLDRSKDIIGYICQPSSLCDCESSQIGERGLGRRWQDNGKSIHRLIEICLELAVLQAIHISVNSGSGIKTLAIRMDRHCENALALAQFLENHPRVTRTRYPFLASHPQHALAQAQTRGGGGVVTFEMEGGLENARRFLESVEVFALAESLGGVESLIEHPAIMTHASVPREAREALGISDTLIRLSVGIEDAGDLEADLAQALEAAYS